MKKIIIVVARNGDLAAERFVSHARAHGVAVQQVTAWREISLAITSTREGDVTLDLRIAQTSEPISGILNRMPPTPLDPGPEERFRASEGTATWWSALAAFTGPVLNRPDPRGYLPPIHLPGFGARLLGLEQAPSTLASRPPTDIADADAHAHRPAHPTTQETAAPPGGAILRYSPAGPIGRLLVAGGQTFPLGHSPWLLPPRLPHGVPLFAVLTLAPGEAGARLICADPIPRWEDYAHLADRVHGALLSALAT